MPRDAEHLFFIASNQMPRILLCKTHADCRNCPSLNLRPLSESFLIAAFSGRGRTRIDVSKLGAGRLPVGSEGFWFQCVFLVRAGFPLQQQLPLRLTDEVSHTRRCIQTDAAVDAFKREGIRLGGS